MTAVLAPRSGGGDDDVASGGIGPYLIGFAERRSGFASRPYGVGVTIQSLDNGDGPGV